jgi:hypothetical protein
MFELNAKVFTPVIVAIIFVCTVFANFTPPAKASTCDPNGGVNVCAASTGTGVAVEQPRISCGYYHLPPWLPNVLQGCNGSNYIKAGRADLNGVQQWVSQYGWTYTGTGDGLRYFTFNNYDFFQPNDTSHWEVPVSDGYASGYCPENPCDFDPWNDYVSNPKAPTAQMRVWADGSERSSPGFNQAYRQLEYPQPGKVGCVGSGTGTVSVTVSKSINVTGNGGGGSIGEDSQSSFTYSQNGECNANSDNWSTYENLNWEGGVPNGGGGTAPFPTESAQSFLNITSTYGYNGDYNDSFLMNLNMLVGWIDKTNNYNIVNYDLFGNVGTPNNTYNSNTWSY